jgi:hypothetical protein
MAEKKKKKTKLTWTNIGIVLIMLAVIGNFYVLKLKADTGAHARDLMNSITEVRTKISGIPAPEVDLVSQLNAVKAELTVINEGFPASVDRNDVLDYILRTASACEIQILPLSSDGWSVQDIGERYAVLGITTTAEGRLENVKKFIDLIQNGLYPTLTIPDFYITRLTPGSSGDAINISAKMRISIYTVPSAEEVSD